MTQTVLVVGSQGVLGSLVADAFDRAGWTTTGTSRRAGAAPGSRYVDLARPGTLDDVLDDVKPDLVVSSVPDSRFTAERAVLRRGGLILNTATLAPADVRQLRRAPAAGEGTAVMYAGIAPGLINLVAASLLADHPGADEVELAFTTSVKATGGPAGLDFGHGGLTAAARHPTAVFPLPPPLGRSRGIGFETVAGWLGPVADGKTVSAYFCLSPAPVRYALLAANAAGLISRLPRKAMTANPPGAPAAASTEPVAHWVAVRRRGTRLAARTVRARGDYRASAAVTVLLARALTDRGAPPRAGVLFPEEAATLDDLLPGLASAGITIADEKPALPD